MKTERPNGAPEEVPEEWERYANGLEAALAAERRIADIVAAANGAAKAWKARVAAAEASLTAAEKERDRATAAYGEMLRFWQPNEDRAALRKLAEDAHEVLAVFPGAGWSDEERRRWSSKALDVNARIRALSAALAAARAQQEPISHSASSASGLAPTDARGTSGSRGKP